jgi:hypothetical protein
MISSVPDPNQDPDQQDPHVLGLPDLDPLVRGMDPDLDPAPNPDPSIRNIRKIHTEFRWGQIEQEQHQEDAHRI